jgi:hypothetical protein
LKLSRIPQQLGKICGRSCITKATLGTHHTLLGLFGQNDHSDGSKNPYFVWAEAEQLKKMAHEIRSVRLEFGESNPQVERFLHYCSLRGANVPGEPKIAQALLHEVESGLSSS